MQREAHAEGTVTIGQSREENGRTRTEQSTTEGQMANGQNDQERLEQATEFEVALQCRYRERSIES